MKIVYFEAIKEKTNEHHVTLDPVLACRRVYKDKLDAVLVKDVYTDEVVYSFERNDYAESYDMIYDIGYQMSFDGYHKMMIYVKSRKGAIDDDQSDMPKSTDR